jgi:ketosteroid isomerase-like protein
MDETERNKDAARRFIAGMGDDPVGSMDLAMAEDCRTVMVSAIRIPGEHTKAQQLQVMAGVHAVFPDGLQMVIHSMIAENDRVVVEAESSATDVSGRPYNNRYLFLLRFRDGKLIELTEYVNTKVAAQFFGG